MAVANPAINRARVTVTQVKHKSRSSEPLVDYTRVCVENCPHCTKQKLQLDNIKIEDVFVVTHLLEDLLKIYNNVCFCLGGKDVKISMAQFSNMCNPSNHARLIRDIVKRIEARR